MIEITLQVNKKLVYNEVEKTTSYIGAKSMNDKDENAYNRIRVTEHDYLMLERFWKDAADSLTGKIRLFHSTVSNSPASNGLKLQDDYELKVEVSDAFNTSMIDSIATGMFSYFVQSITSAWLLQQNNDGAAAFATQAAALLQELTDKLYYRLRPQRNHSTDIGMYKVVWMTGDVNVDEHPTVGQQMGIIYKNEGDEILQIRIDAETYQTPENEDMVIDVRPKGYGEVNLLNMDGVIYVRAA